MWDKNLDVRTVNTIKSFIIDGVRKANSGHTGGAMSSTPFVYVLYSEYLKYNVNDPKWIGRDRFVLSAGHESMLLYTVLYMSRFLKLEDLKQFRQIGSLTPGHPEIETNGVDFGTGPLGQGAASSVGVAAIAKHLGACLNSKLFDYKVYALLGDGCMQEDVVFSAASLAGHWGLNNLVWYYDKNNVQIDGASSQSTSRDDISIFKALNWDVVSIDGKDLEAIREVLDNVRDRKYKKPLLIVGNSIMADGAYSMEGSNKTHGSPFSEEEARATKEKLGLNPDKEFDISEDVLDYFRRNEKERLEYYNEWKNDLSKFLENEDNKKLYDSYFNVADSTIEGIDCFIEEFDSKNNTKQISTREAFGKGISLFSDKLPSIIGGSADLIGSNGLSSFAKKESLFSKDNYKGRNIAFGVREFPMGCIVNGMSLDGMSLPFCTTFLVFSDYLRSAVRSSALQNLRVIYGFSHDSFYVGEDGPTHQPVEHIMSLRAVPNLYVYRPSDAEETVLLVKQALLNKKPSVFCTSRQGVDLLDISKEKRVECLKGCFEVYRSEGFDRNKDKEIKNRCVIYASGSEVSLSIKVARILEEKGILCSIIATPCWELFDKQDEGYRKSIYQFDIKNRISIEAGISLGWERFIGIDGLSISLDSFGQSAPAKVLEEKFGFTPQSIVERIIDYIDR